MAPMNWRTARWRGLWLWPVLLLAGGTLLSRAQDPPAPLASSYRFAIEVLDENGVAVPDALAALTGPSRVLHCQTDFAGRCEFQDVAAGVHRLRIEKLGFYVLDLPDVPVPESSSLEVSLRHEQEVRETVDVVESPPAIDPEKTSSTESLGQRELLNVPYPVARDVRNALPLLPNVVQDNLGQIHIAGSSGRENLSLLDGFDVSQPVAGFLEMRVNADAVRTIDADAGRYSVQHGRGDSLLSMNTGIGDDRFRFAASHFIPSFQRRKGVHFNRWVPRATLSGPLKRGRVWFYLAPELEYDQEIVKELPAPQDRSTQWRTGNLTKLQANLTNANVLTAEFLVNNYHAPNAGLSSLRPWPATLDQSGAVYIGQLKDQHYFGAGILLENGFAVDDFSGSQRPQGNMPSVLTPDGWQGSSYAGWWGSARRLQWITNLYLPLRHWHGRHEVRLGGDLDRVTYHRTYYRAPVKIVREDGTMARQVAFSPSSRATASNFQRSAYLQDRWSLGGRLVLEGGLRIDWDEIVQKPVAAPRLAGTYLLDSRGRTKLVAGVGLFYLSSNLDYTSGPRAGHNIDLLYTSDGRDLRAIVPSRFYSRVEELDPPRVANWSTGIEQELPREVYLRLEYMKKQMVNGFVYQSVGGPRTWGGDYVLSNGRRDDYRGLELTLRHSFRNVYPILFSYTRSSARSNALLNPSVDELIQGPQQGGPQPWDVPNRWLAWGWLPGLKKIDVGYSLEWRDGFPFTVVNQEQVVVGAPNSRRFPRYFSTSLAAERRFQFRRMNLAFRASAENVTGSSNAFAVNNNVDSPHYLTFAGMGHMAITGRVRFLGWSKAGAAVPTGTSDRTRP